MHDFRTRGVAAPGRTARRRSVRLAAVVAIAGLTAAACGGGGSKSKAAGPSTATSEATTSTTAATTDSTVAGDATTTTAAGAASSKATTTTAKRTTATTKKSAIAPSTANKGVTNVQGGITNVTSASTAPPSDVTPGGTLTVYKPSEIPGMDPVNISNSGSFDAPPAFAVYDALAYSDNGTVKPQAMESLTSSDALVWTLKLHPNMKFSDGTAWDAAAVKFNWQRMADPKLAARRGPLAAQIAQMDALDPVTLKVTLKSKNALFPGAVTLIPFIGSPTAIQQKGDAKFNDEPVGGGPFVLKSWTKDSQMVFARNTTYWNAPQPYLDGMVFKMIVDETQRYNTYCASPANGLIFIQSVGAADTVSKQNCGTVEPFVLNGGINMFYNTTKAPMSNLKLRQGIAKAINFDEYSKVVTLGIIPPNRSVFRPDSPFYDANILQPAYDPAGAQALFDQAAQELGVSTINIPMSAFPSPNYANSAAYIQGVLNKYKGIKIDITTVATSAHVTECQQRTYNGICHYGNPFDDPDPTWVNPFLCTSSTNPTGWCNKEFDRLILDNETTLDPNQRIKDLKDAQKIFYAEQPSLYFEQPYSWVYHGSTLHDFKNVDDGCVLFNQLCINQK
jgi:peptide/nickel transport system substrate-binding protein